MMVIPEADFNCPPEIHLKEMMQHVIDYYLVVLYLYLTDIRVIIDKLTQITSLFQSHIYIIVVTAF